jgi:hypothetical protein
MIPPSLKIFPKNIYSPFKKMLLYLYLQVRGVVLGLHY